MGNKPSTSNMGLLWSRLETRERALIYMIGRRLLAGQARFGELSPDKKEWVREALEEAADMSVYIGARLLDIQDEENRAKRKKR